MSIQNLKSPHWNDQAHGQADGTDFLLGPTTIVVDANATTPADRWGAGIRFGPVNVPQGATITLAQLALHMHDTKDDPDTRIYADDTSNSPNFVDYPFVWQRTHSAAFIDWDATDLPTGWNSVVVTALVQAVVNRSDWVFGNYLTLLIEGQATSQQAAYFAGYGDETAGLGALTPQLYISDNSDFHFTDTWSDRFDGPAGNLLVGDAASFDAGISTWHESVNAASFTGEWSGDGQLRMLTTTAVSQITMASHLATEASRPQVLPYGSVYFSADVRAVAGVGRSVRVEGYFLNEAGSIVSSNLGSLTAVTSDLQRVTLVATPPSTTTRARMRVSVLSTQVGDDIRWDNAHLGHEETLVPPPVAAAGSFWRLPNGTKAPIYTATGAKAIVRLPSGLRL